MVDLVGKTLLERYEVREHLGRGGMADVYKVWDQDRDTWLAAKFMHNDLAQDVVALRRFKREAETLEKLAHPSIVRFYGLEEAELMVFMLLDYVEGETLKKMIFRERKPLAIEVLSGMMRPVCSALKYAHKQGMVHNDIKPANIMINDSGKFVLTDFGIARMTDAATATLVGAGTPAYMSPEQIRGEDPQPQTDMYALGIVLYEMLTGGERPFTGELASITGSTAQKVIWEQVNLKPRSPRKYNAAISPALEAVVMRCLAKDAGARYGDMMAVLAAFTQAVGGVVVPAPMMDAEVEETVDALAEVEAVVETPAVKPARKLAAAKPEETHDAVIEGRRATRKQKSGTNWLKRVPGWGWGVLGLIVIGGIVLAGVLGGGGGEVAGVEGTVTATATMMSTRTIIPTDTPVPTITSLPTATFTPEPTPFGGGSGRIVFSSDRDGDSEIYAMYADGGDVEQLTDNDWNDSEPLSSPDGEYILFKSDRTGDNEFYVMSTSGDNSWQLTNDTEGGWGLNWSPNSMQIVFTSDRDGDDELYVIDIKGSNLQKLTDNYWSDRYAEYSPDGEQIAFGSNQDGDWEIYVMDVDGGNVRQLTHNEGIDYGPKWSPDGQKITFPSDASGQDALYVMDVDGDNLIELAEIGWRGYYMVWSPDSEQIVFLYQVGISDIYIIDADGENLLQLTDNDQDDYAPQWSADGRKIIFASNRDGDSEIYLMYLDGSGVRQLTENDSSDWGPSWQPVSVGDRQNILEVTATPVPALPTATPQGGGSGRVVFSSGRDGDYEIYVMDVDGGNVEQLTDNDWSDSGPKWSPDGKQIVFFVTLETYSVIYVMDADGSNLESLTDNDSRNWSPDWSPVGSQIVFVSDRDGGDPDLFLMDVDGQNVRKLADSVWGGVHFSPDGRQIVFTSYPDTNNNGTHEIFSMDTDGSNLVQLTHNDWGDSDASWSPDGRKILFSSFREGDHEIYVMDADGGNLVKLTDNNFRDIDPSWSPDGNFIVFTSYRDGNNEIYVMDADGGNVWRLTDNDWSENSPSWQP